MKLIDQIKKFQPYNEQEQTDQRIMLMFLNEGKHVLTRQNEIAHFTASSWVVNCSRNKVLMAYHNIYHSWSWTGGHADGNEDLLSVALRETSEETGAAAIQPITKEIFSLETIHVKGHEKRGKYVPCHLHMNITYLLEADDTSTLTIKPDENSGVKWFSIHEVLNVAREPFMVDRIYKKLNEKLSILLHQHDVALEK